MTSRGLFTALAGLMVCYGGVAAPTAHAAGPLAGEWTLSIVNFYGAPVPFAPPGNVFVFTEESAFQAQNSPAVGSPLCTMTGTRTGTMLLGSEICGIPRNSFGALMGVVDSETNPRRMFLFWADSKGVYLMRGNKTRDN
jgi:hypothetical protein